MQNQFADPCSWCIRTSHSYWPAVHGTEGVITVWVAVDDADEENGAMQLLPGTHKPYVDHESHAAPSGSIVSREVDIDPAVETTAVTVAVPAGSVSIHDSYLIHGSGVNHSGRRRAAYTIRYINPRRAFCDTTRHPVPAFLVRGDAGLFGESYVDARPGTTPECWSGDQYRNCKLYRAISMQGCSFCRFVPTARQWCSAVLVVQPDLHAILVNSHLPWIFRAPLRCRSAAS